MQAAPRHTWKAFALVVLATFLFLWLGVPALGGYHLGGCNPLIDHERLVRLGLEWCR